MTTSPLPDFSDIADREAEFRHKHGLPIDAIVSPEELYSREEMIDRALAALRAIPQKAAA